MGYIQNKRDIQKRSNIQKMLIYSEKKVHSESDATILPLYRCLTEESGAMDVLIILTKAIPISSASLTLSGATYP